MALGHAHGHPFNDGMGGVGGAAVLAPGVYLRAADANGTPVEATAANWNVLASQVLNGADYDQTTSEGSAKYTKILFAFGAGVTLQSWLGSINYESGNLNVYWSADGVAWNVWDAPVIPGHLGHQWENLTQNPADQAGAFYCQFIGEDIGNLDPPDVFRFGDIGLTYV
jgi:hypothetical protein